MKNTMTTRHFAGFTTLLLLAIFQMSRFGLMADTIPFEYMNRWLFGGVMLVSILIFILVSRWLEGVVHNAYMAKFVDLCIALVVTFYSMNFLAVLPAGATSPSISIFLAQAFSYTTFLVIGGVLVLTFIYWVIFGRK